MADDAVVFACANPVPEIWPEEARAAGARIVATGRSDFPNQLNNALVFPGLFRGVLDVGASVITEGMAAAAASALSRHARATGLAENAILPDMADWRAAVAVAVAVGRQAQAEGIASRDITAGQIETSARAAIERVHAEMALLFGND